jgi:hypothetical protein
MVGNPGGEAGPRRVRRLKEPRPVAVQTDERGIPAAIMSSIPLHRQEQAVSVRILRRPWRIDQLWWRPGGAVSRRYFQVAPEDGPPLTLFQDLESGLWYRQEY